IVCITFAISLPLYHAKYHASGIGSLILGSLFLLVKLWNMAVVWECTYAIDVSVRQRDMWIRIVINFFFFYTLLKGWHLYTILCVACMVGYLLIQYIRTKGKSINWEYLIECEQRSWMFFYRIANMFVDVPHMKVKVKRRKWLDFLLANIPFS